MASNSFGSKNSRGGQEKGYHVESSDLLALMRNQRFEAEGRARAHLAVCEPCQRAYVDLAQTSRMLDMLGQMAMSQRYPELQAGVTLARLQERVPGHMNRPAVHASGSVYRSSRTRGSLRLVSIPVGMVIALTTVVVVLAFTLVRIGGIPGLQNSFSGNPVSNPSVTTDPRLKPHQTPTVSITKGVSTTAPTFGATPSPTGATEPTVTAEHGTTPTTPVGVTSPTPTVPTAPNSIYVCTSAQDWARNILDICGNNFTQGDRVQLIITFQGFSHPIPIRDAMVDTYGQFTFRLYIWSCRWAPVTAVVKDMSINPAVVSNTLNTLPTQICTDQNGSPTPTPGDH